MKENKLIAEFMGFTHEKNIGWYDNDMLMSQNVYDSQDGNCFDELLFHTSWDWLMPVVEKIEGLRDENGNAYRFTIDMCNAQIEETNIEILGGAFKIDTTYKAVVEFIKQYNKQKL